MKFLQDMTFAEVGDSLGVKYMLSLIFFLHDPSVSIKLSISRPEPIYKAEVKLSV